MRRIHWTVAIAILTLAMTVSCGGGGGDDSIGGGSNIVAADFTPTDLTPGANTVSALGSSSSNIVTLSVMATGTAGIDAGVSTALIQLRLRATSSGTSPIGFENADLLNSNNPPTKIVGIAFTGGTLTAN